MDKWSFEDIPVKDVKEIIEKWERNIIDSHRSSSLNGVWNIKENKQKTDVTSLSFTWILRRYSKNQCITQTWLQYLFIFRGYNRFPSIYRRQDTFLGALKIFLFVIGIFWVTKPFIVGFYWKIRKEEGSRRAVGLQLRKCLFILSSNRKSFFQYNNVRVKIDLYHICINELFKNKQLSIFSE